MNDLMQVYNLFINNSYFKLPIFYNIEVRKKLTN